MIDARKRYKTEQEKTNFNLTSFPGIYRIDPFLNWNYRFRSVTVSVCLNAVCPFLVTPDDRFTEHPANVTAMQGNNASFDCALMSGSSVLWQRSTNTSTTFVTADTHPG